MESKLRWSTVDRIVDASVKVGLIFVDGRVEIPEPKVHDGEGGVSKAGNGILGEKVVMVFGESLEFSVVEGFTDAGVEVVTAKVVGGVEGKSGLFNQMGVALSPESENRAPYDVDQAVGPKVRGMVWEGNLFGAKAVDA